MTAAQTGQGAALTQAMQPRWEQALRRTRQEQAAHKGIGTLREKPLHAAVKYTIEPNDSYHEVRIGRYVADLVTQEGIVEVQTGSLRSLCRKLDAFLPKAPVTVVHPLPGTKWICWVDEDSGEVGRRVRSPKKGQPLDAFYELYWLGPQRLAHPGLTVQLWLVDVEEYRLLNGWSSDKKRGAQRLCRLPLALQDIVTLHTPQDYAALLPQLPQPFTKRELARAAARSDTWAQRTLDTLRRLCLLREEGRRGRAKLYRLSL